MKRTNTSRLSINVSKCHNSETKLIIKGDTGYYLCPIEDPHPHYCELKDETKHLSKTTK